MIYGGISLFDILLCRVRPTDSFTVTGEKKCSVCATTHTKHCLNSAIGSNAGGRLSHTNEAARGHTQIK